MRGQLDTYKYVQKPSPPDYEEHMFIEKSDSLFPKNQKHRIYSLSNMQNGMIVHECKWRCGNNLLKPQITWGLHSSSTQTELQIWVCLMFIVLQNWHVCLKSPTSASIDYMQIMNV